MLNFSPTAPESELNVLVANLIERCADLSNVARAARLADMAAEAIAAIDGAAQAPAADVVRKLSEARDKLEGLEAEARANAETSEMAKISLTRMVNALRNIKI